MLQELLKMEVSELMLLVSEERTVVDCSPDLTNRRTLCSRLCRCHLQSFSIWVYLLLGCHLAVVPLVRRHLHPTKSTVGHHCCSFLCLLGVRRGRELEERRRLEDLRGLWIRWR